MPVVCPHCSREFPGDHVNARHLAKCSPSSGPAVPPCLCGHESTSLTQMKRHRKACETWQARDAQALASERRVKTNLTRHGVAVASQAPEVRAQRAATNRERYGAENPFAKESSVFNKVQASLEGKRPVLRGAKNPFAQSEVKEKIRARLRARYGVENPQQAPGVRERTRATMVERYGGELLASPEIRAKAEATNLARYGAPFAGGTPAVQAKIITTNMTRYGVPHTCMNLEVRRKQLETMESHYGEHFFASDEGKKAVRATLKEKFGVEFPGAIEGHWEKAVATFKERLGVEHPLRLAEYLDKMVPKMVATKMARYGSPWGPVCADGPNGLERKLMALAPSDSLLFTGDGKFWRWVPRLGHHKNPDFIVPGPDHAKPKKGVTRVVEAFGNFWHSKMFTGKAPFEHESELIDAYRDIGIECLIVWESEVKEDPEGVRSRLASFLADDLPGLNTNL